MKTRKRGRSPAEDCNDCLPISKRITRLNIQSTSRLSLDEKDQHLSEEPGTSSCTVTTQMSPAPQAPWQQERSYESSCQGLHLHSNNNLDYLPCGSSQCDSVQFISNNRNSLHAYAVHHGMSPDDFQGYKPELKETDNPHYYQINSVLYNAHLEKASRHGSTMKQ